MLLIGVVSSVAQLAASHAQGRLNIAPANITRPTVSNGGKVVARVNGVALTETDLLRKMYVIFPYAKQHNGGFPKAMEQDIRHGAMKMIVFEELCYQEAERRHMVVAPARIDKIRAQIRADIHDPDAYKVFLKEQGDGTEAGLRRRIRRMLLIQELMKAEIVDKSIVTPTQLRTYYDQNLDKFHEPELVSFQTISTIPPAGSGPAEQKEARKHADSILEQAKKTKNYEEFGLLAEKVSDDDFRVNMGYRKPVDVSKLPKNIATILTGMKPGQVSDVIAIDGGFTIMRLIDHSAPTTRKFADVKVELAKNLRQQKQEELRTALNERLRARSKVEEL